MGAGPAEEGHGTCTLSAGEKYLRLKLLPARVANQGLNTRWLWMPDNGVLADDFAERHYAAG